MKPTFSVRLNSRPKPNGLFEVMIRVIYKRTSKTKSIKVFVQKDHWYKKAGDKQGKFKKPKYGYWIKNGDPLATQKNRKIKEELEGYEKEIYKALETESQGDLDNAVDKIFTSAKKPGFISYARQRIEIDAKTKRISYKRQMDSAINKFEKFIEKKLGDSDVLFTQITHALLRDYDSYLKSEHGNSVNTITGNFKKIRSILYNAILDGYLPQEKNPFFKFTLKSAPTTKERLNREEISKLEAADLELGSPGWHARNYFLFSYYCAGIRAGDLIGLKWKNVHNKIRLVYQMSKNGKYSDVTLVPQARRILDYYRTPESKDNDLIFPIVHDSRLLDNPVSRFGQVNSKATTINSELKKVALKAKIKKNLSFHVARHSFADIARKSGASIYAISKALNHSKISTTEAYISTFDQEATDDLINTLFSQKQQPTTKKGGAK